MCWIWYVADLPTSVVWHRNDAQIADRMSLVMVLAWPLLVFHRLSSMYLAQWFGDSATARGPGGRLWPRLYSSGSPLLLTIREAVSRHCRDERNKAFVGQNRTELSGTY